MVLFRTVISGCGATGMVKQLLCTQRGVRDAGGVFKVTSETVLGMILVLVLSK